LETIATTNLGTHIFNIGEDCGEHGQRAGPAQEKFGAKSVDFEGTDSKEKQGCPCREAREMVVRASVEQNEKKVPTAVMCDESGWRADARSGIHATS